MLCVFSRYHILCTWVCRWLIGIYWDITFYVKTWCCRINVKRVYHYIFAIPWGDGNYVCPCRTTYIEYRIHWVWQYRRDFPLWFARCFRCFSMPALGHPPPCFPRCVSLASSPACFFCIFLSSLWSVFLFLMSILVLPVLCGVLLQALSLRHISTITCSKLA